MSPPRPAGWGEGTPTARGPARRGSAILAACANPVASAAAARAPGDDAVRTTRATGDDAARTTRATGDEATRAAKRHAIPSAIAHLAPALALAPAFARPGVPRRLWALGACAALAPDLDVVGFALGVPYDHPLGHRGLWHSLPFAALAAAALAALAFPHGAAGLSRARAWLYLFLAMGSHGLLDAATDGGLGIALLAPFDSRRYFLPVRPIAVSPIGVGAFLSARGLAVIESELLYVWLPFALLGFALWRWRR